MYHRVILNSQSLAKRMKRLRFQNEPPMRVCFVSSVLQKSGPPGLHQIKSLRPGVRGLCFEIFFIFFLKQSSSYDLNFLSRRSICVCQAVRSRRHRQVQLDVAGDETGAPQFSGQSRRQRKPSLKAKTNMNVKISGNFNSSLTFIQANEAANICNKRLCSWVFVINFHMK